MTTNTDQKSATKPRKSPRIPENCHPGNARFLQFFVKLVFSVLNFREAVNMKAIVTVVTYSKIIFSLNEAHYTKL